MELASVQARSPVAVAGELCQQIMISHAPDRLLSSLCSFFNMTARTAQVSRKTNETQIEVFVNLDCTPGSGQVQSIDVSTGIGFLDHVVHLSYSTLLTTHRLSRCIVHWQNMVDFH